jgi:carbonic anhydrase
MLERRSFLRFATASAGCAFCLAATRGFAATPAHGGAPHWSYEGASGPEHWDALTPDFKTCKIGLEQTPLDIAGGIKAELGAVNLAYQPMKLRILNNGHTIQVNADPGSRCEIGGVAYELLQFHFHHPSEHLLAGKLFELECHFVHKSATGDLAVLGVMMKAGARNAALAPIWAAMPRDEALEHKTEVAVDAAALFPKGRGYFRYMGSLTTPPCSEGLTWTVYKEPVELSPEQIWQFASLFPNNARPVQKRNRRFILEG